MSDVSITDLIARLRYLHEPSNSLALADLTTVMNAAADALENANTTIAVDLGYMRALEAKIAALEAVTAVEAEYQAVCGSWDCRAPECKPKESN